MDEQREILNRMIESGAPVEQVLEQSQKLDLLIVEFYKRSDCCEA